MNKKAEPETGQPGETEQPKLELQGTRQFTAWLAGQKASIAFTTYQSGKVFFIGLQADGRMSVFERTLNRCMGMTVTPDAQIIYKHPVPTLAFRAG